MDGFINDFGEGKGAANDDDSYSGAGDTGTGDLGVGKASKAS
jgi:hypothetical protein